MEVRYCSNLSRRETLRVYVKLLLPIAIMTMFFLPATSIAAILSVPWYQGHGDFSVAQVAAFVTVTITVTAVVFLIWWKVEDSDSDAKDELHKA